MKINSRVLLLAALIPVLPGGARPSPAPAAALESITQADLRSDLYFLASDEMLGRNVNTPENRIASRYLAHRFESLGLEPVEGSYYQYFTVVQAELGEANRLEMHRSDSPVSRKAVLREEYVPALLTASAKTTAALVFAGYGITAPGHGYDDYRGLDVKGRIVAVLEHEPGEHDADSPFDGLTSSPYSSRRFKILNAQEHGAAAVVFVPHSGHGTENFAGATRFTWPADPSRGRYRLKIWSDRVRIPALSVSRSTARALLDLEPGRLQEIEREIDATHEPRGFAVEAVSATIETDVTRRPHRFRNVLARLGGADPALRDELVIIGAHFDHVGARGGDIFNGADDDASGTAGLLEIAQAYALSPEKPARSLLFAAWNAEERGLLGSHYYAERPPVALAQTAALFQMDMIGRNEEVPDAGSPRFRGLEVQTSEQNRNSLNVLGYSRSSDMRRLVERANSVTGLELKFRYDNHPINLLRRSDNWPFLIKGVPALFFHTGLHPDYHRSTDTADKINYPKLERIVRLVFLASWEAANASGRPALNRAETGR